MKRAQNIFSLLSGYVWILACSLMTIQIHFGLNLSLSYQTPLSSSSVWSTNHWLSSHPQLHQRFSFVLSVFTCTSVKVMGQRCQIRSVIECPGLLLVLQVFNLVFVSHRIPRTGIMFPGVRCIKQLKLCVRTKAEMYICILFIRFIELCVRLVVCFLSISVTVAQGAPARASFMYPQFSINGCRNTLKHLFAYWYLCLLSHI